MMLRGSMSALHIDAVIAADVRCTCTQTPEEDLSDHLQLQV